MECKRCGTDVEKTVGNGLCSKCFMIASMGEHSTPEDGPLAEELRAPKNTEHLVEAIKFYGDALAKQLSK